MGNQRETQGNGASFHYIESPWYNILLVSSRAIALSLDPLFFFVPVIHEDKKCISEDKNMWINAILWRSVLDFIYLVHFVVKSYKKKEDKKDQWYLWMWFMFDILVILPIPQVLMTNALSEMRRTKYTNIVTILNAVILIQYGPRILQIYLSLKELEGLDKIPIKIRASFNFFLYLLAGHVFGAFWYFFSTQRLTSCWRKACLHQGGCVQGSFNCDHRFGNLSALHDFCSIDTTNTSTFDFGIFLDARKSGILESMDFPKKLIFSAWWGLRNLSSFGSNLQTSTYIWENVFALGISIFGLLLFLYFLGNLQVYMQRSASKYVEKSGEGKNPALNEAVVDNILKELGQLCTERIELLQNQPKKDGAVVEPKTASILQRAWCCNHPKCIGA